MDDDFVRDMETRKRMMKNETTLMGHLLCWLGIHDWYVLKDSCDSSVDREVACELDPLEVDEFRPQAANFSGALEHRWCMRCNLEQDQIDAYREKRRARMLAVVSRFGVEAIEPRKYGRNRHAPPPPPPKK